MTEFIQPEIINVDGRTRWKERMDLGWVTPGHDLQIAVAHENGHARIWIGKIYRYWLIVDGKADGLAHFLTWKLGEKI